MKTRIKNTVQKNGKRYVCRIYDNQGKTLDRYTIALKAEASRGVKYWPYLGCNSLPFHSIGYHGESYEFLNGKHLGKRVCFEDCPEQVQQFIMQNLG